MAAIQPSFALPSRPVDATNPLTPPTEHPSDADTDLAILREVPEHFEVTDEGTANWLCRKIRASRAYADEVRIWADRETARAAREEKVLMFLFGRQLERWARDRIARLKGKKKSINLPAGTVGFRASTPRLVIDNEHAVIEWARQHAPSAVHTVEKVLKSVLDNHFKITGELPDDGVHVEPATEKFFVR
jgi:phage host-nuclease inhibitor protein Gam